MSTIQELAKEASKQFERIKRKPEDENEIYVRRSGAPEWVAELVHDAHGDMSPDDHRYAFIVEALDAICDNPDVDAAREALEADVYTHDLTEWLHSRNDRANFVDEARREWGADAGGLTDDLARGQLFEKYEVFDAVVAFLESQI